MALINLDWDILLSNDGWYPDGSGNNLVKSAELHPAVLGMFNRVEIMKYTNGKLNNVQFYSQTSSLNSDLMQLVSYCATKWGNDKLGQGWVHEKDPIYLRLGRYSRMWNSVWIDQDLNKTLRLTLFLRNSESFGDLINDPLSNSSVSPQPIEDTSAGFNSSVHSQSSEPTEKCVVLNKPLTTLQIILCIILSLFIVPLGTIGVFIYGLLRYVDKSAKVRWLSNSVGTTMRKSTIPASPEVVAINKRNGKTAIIISLVCAAIVALSIITDPELTKSLTLLH
jgi:hypothetical protein